MHNTAVIEARSAQLLRVLSILAAVLILAACGTGGLDSGTGSTTTAVVSSRGPQLSACGRTWWNGAATPAVIDMPTYHKSILQLHRSSSSDVFAGLVLQLTNTCTGAAVSMKPSIAYFRTLVSSPAGRPVVVLMIGRKLGTATLTISSSGRNSSYRVDVSPPP